jgi:hypothetical protein
MNDLLDAVVLAHARLEHEVVGDADPQVHWRA